MGAVVTYEIGIGDFSVRRDIGPNNETNSVSCANTTVDTIGESAQLICKYSPPCSTMKTSQERDDGFLLADFIVEMQSFWILESLGTFKSILHREMMCCCSTI